jgi:hypothetical protein
MEYRFIANICLEMLWIANGKQISYQQKVTRVKDHAQNERLLLNSSDSSLTFSKWKRPLIITESTIHFSDGTSMTHRGQRRWPLRIRRIRAIKEQLECFMESKWNSQLGIKSNAMENLTNIVK